MHDFLFSSNLHSICAKLASGLFLATKFFKCLKETHRSLRKFGKMAQELSQKQQQILQLSPEMRRSLEILQAPSVELNQIIAQELAENPALEFPEASESVSIEDFSKKNSDDEKTSSLEEDGTRDSMPPSDSAKPSEILSSQSETSGAQKNGMSEDDAQRVRSFLFDSVESKEYTLDKLIDEARINAQNPESAEAFEFLVGELDERGFLSKEALEKARRKNFSEDAVSEALCLLKNSEPFGIGAFDMRECLMIQLEKLGMKNSLTYRILEDDFDMLMSHRLSKIAEKHGKSENEISNAIEILKDLNTSPARALHEDAPQYAYADLKFFKGENDSGEVALTGEYFPKLRINADYRRMAALGVAETSGGTLKLKSEDLSIVKKQIRDAKALIEMLDQRQQTLLKIGMSILDRQPDFIELGKTALRPMTMQNVADDLGLHASTIGRAISEKYAETPFGILPLKVFFSGGISSKDGDDNGGISSVSIKEKIKSIIGSENKRNPLSDAQIAEILKEASLIIARRTVAKYREEMGILSKGERKIY